ncbi:MAG: DUF1838 family protein [Wenzhouxiangella sp.]|nr:DUF1838 family protein [Wenzhouxiangella sp.]
MNARLKLSLLIPSILMLGVACADQNAEPPLAEQAAEAPAANGTLAAGAGQPLDLGQSADSLTAFAKMRCSLDPEETTIAWWYGTLFADFPDSQPQPLMRFEGFNACRMLPHEEGGFKMVTREVTYYQDLETGEIIETWDNPFTEETVEILQVANDPVSHQMPLAGRDYSTWPWVQMGDQLMLTMNIPLAYPNPLSVEEFPDESSGPMYFASEHFTFFAPIDQINDPDIQSTHATYGWARTGPWLPWMRMGQRPGGLIYSGQGMKLPGGYDQLPEAIRAYTDEHFPEYATAPDSFYGPNATSWNEYRRIMRERREAEANGAE